MIPIPHSWGARRLREFNPNHEPAGSAAGGQFAKKKGWHLTANPNFVPDPAFKPQLNSLGGDLMGDTRPAGLFVGDPEYWMHAHGYERPYVAEIEGYVTNPPGSVMLSGHEEFMQGDMKTVRVLTIDEYARETFGDRGWVEEFFSEPLRYGDKAPKFKNYVGRPVSAMSAKEIAAWEKKFAAYAGRADGPHPAKQRRGVSGR